MRYLRVNLVVLLAILASLVLAQTAKRPSAVAQIPDRATISAMVNGWLHDLTEPPTLFELEKFEKTTRLQGFVLYERMEPITDRPGAFYGLLLYTREQAQGMRSWLLLKSGVSTNALGFIREDLGYIYDGGQLVSFTDPVVLPVALYHPVIAKASITLKRLPQKWIDIQPTDQIVKVQYRKTTAYFLYEVEPT